MRYSPVLFFTIIILRWLCDHYCIQGWLCAQLSRRVTSVKGGCEGIVGTTSPPPLLPHLERL